ncbi:MAG TPA: hypothetical protein VHF25_00110 [Nitriliruptorales bacterium]|nr:hypothetical protein [Nitriliruptorales bacterium]
MDDTHDSTTSDDTTDAHRAPGDTRERHHLPTSGRTVEEAREGLLAQAFLFDDPTTYEAGVRDAFAAMAELLVQGVARTA